MFLLVTIPFLSDKASFALGIYGTRKFQKLALGHISFATLWKPLFDINSIFKFIYIYIYTLFFADVCC
jgi:hypothetical protein